MKRIRVPLALLDAQDADAMLDFVTDLDGVVAALLDEDGSTLEVVIGRGASALHVREQLWAATRGAATA